jgi:hypothetical protein
MIRAAAAAGLRVGGRNVFRILITKSGLSVDRQHTLFQGVKTAIDRAMGEIGAPLTFLLIVLRLSAVEGVPTNEGPDCNR